MLSQSPGRAFVLGLGITCPAGTGRSAHDGFASGKSFAELVEWPEYGVTAVGCRVPESDLDAGRLVHADRRRLDRIAHLSILAADQAIADANFLASQFDAGRCGLMAGIGFGGISTLTAQHAVLQRSGPRRMSPFAVPACMPSGAAAVLAMRYGLDGPVATIASACASGTQAIGEGARLLRYGVLDVVVVGGAEAPFDPLPIAGFTRMDAMTKRLDDPEVASRPFDKDRDGFVMGEGAAFFVLGTEEASKRLECRPIAEIVGYAATTDAQHLTAPDQEGRAAVRCIDTSLVDAGVPIASLSHINAHGTSTPLNDAAEAAALQRCANGGPLPPVMAVKGAIGHLMGGAGAVELAASLLAVEGEKLFPTVNFQEPDKGVTIDVCTSRQAFDVERPFLSTSFGFGGQNASIVVKPMS